MSPDERLRDRTDPLLGILRTAQAWHVAPSQFVGASSVTVTEYLYADTGRLVRSVTTVAGWTDEDRELAFALAAYEADLCPGCREPLSETTLPERSDAYIVEPPLRCHRCTGMAVAAEASQDLQHPTALLLGVQLDDDLVALNREAPPPLPADFYPVT